MDLKPSLASQALPAREELRRADAWLGETWRAVQSRHPTRGARDYVQAHWRRYVWTLAALIGILKDAARRRWGRLWRRLVPSFRGYLVVFAGVEAGSEFPEAGRRPPLAR